MYLALIGDSEFPIIFNILYYMWLIRLFKTIHFNLQ